MQQLSHNSSSSMPSFQAKTALAVSCAVMAVSPSSLVSGFVVAPTSSARGARVVASEGVATASIGRRSQVLMR